MTFNATFNERAETMSRTEAKQLARRMGLDWSAVVAAFDGLRAEQKAAREFEWSVRQMAWSSYAWTPACREFWRHGMQKRFARAFGDGDRTLIPRFDVVAQCIAAEWPALNRDGDPGEALFELLARPFDRLPTAGETWVEALRMSENTIDDVSFDVVPSDEPF